MTISTRGEARRDPGRRARGLAPVAHGPILGLALGLALALTTVGSARAAAPADDDMDRDGAENRAYAYCIAGSDNRVIATDVMKVRLGFTLARLSTEWTAYVRATYRAKGSCRMFPAKLSKINAYSRLDSDVDAMTDVVRKNVTGRPDVVRSFWKPW